MSEQNKKPRRVVNKASSGLRRPGANDSTRRRATRVTAGQDNRPVESETATSSTDVAAVQDADSSASSSRHAFGRDLAVDPGQKHAGMTEEDGTPAEEDGTPGDKREVAADEPTVRQATAAGAPTARRSPRLAALGPARGSFWSMAIGLLVAAVVVTAVAVVAFLRPGVEDRNKAFVDTQATQQVSAAGVNALKTIYSYDVKTIGGYKDAVHKVVTGKMLGDFDKFADTTVSAVQQAQSTATATPDPVGVTLLTNDRAELLVDLTVAATKDGAPQESASGPIVLHMQKINGHWLASEIADR